MTYLLSTYWPWMLIALLLGIAVGFMTFQRSVQAWRPVSWPGWLRLLCLLFVVGLVVAVLKWLPGLAGQSLEAALLLVGSYIVGYFAGSWLASLRAAEPAVQQQPAMAPAAAPVAAAPAATALASDGHPGQRPPSIDRVATPDNLKRIAGVGHTNEIKLNELGIWTFSQIAAWNHQNAEWVGSYLSFPGRIEREDWIGQAARLAQGLETEFSRRVDHGDVPTSL
ncbi:hypothetical protein ACIQWS_18285 [Phyllobacterium sp. NPDC097923]|uniref:hypothetical protein n=1 Tax=Phyllobacterium sp. NPDC097923 TaxID=3364404 RepID=UPI00383A92C0